MNRITGVIFLGLLLAAAPLRANDELDGFVEIEDAEGNPVYAADASGWELYFYVDESGQAYTVDQDGVVTEFPDLPDDPAQYPE